MLVGEPANQWQAVEIPPSEKLDHRMSTPTRLCRLVGEDAVGL